MAWSRDGGEIWFTASTNGNNRMLYAVTPARRQRLVDTGPGKLQLEDMGADGRALLQLQSAGRAMVARWRMLLRIGGGGRSESSNRKRLDFLLTVSRLG